MNVRSGVQSKLGLAFTNGQDSIGEIETKVLGITHLLVSAMSVISVILFSYLSKQLFCKLLDKLNHGSSRPS